jgi:hypothetical protein
VRVPWPLHRALRSKEVDQNQPEVEKGHHDEAPSRAGAHRDFTVIISNWLARRNRLGVAFVGRGICREDI